MHELLRVGMFSFSRTHIPQWISTDFEIIARMRTTLANGMLEGNLRELKLRMPLFLLVLSLEGRTTVPRESCSSPAIPGTSSRELVLIPCIQNMSVFVMYLRR